MIRRRCLLIAASAAVCGLKLTAAEDKFSPHKKDDAIARGIAFLLAAQSSDGAWRSQTYGSLKDGAALTPLVLRAIVSTRSNAVAAATERGAKYTAVLAEGLDGSGDPNGLYLAANAAVVLSEPGFERYRGARNQFVNYLSRRQLVEALGWSQSDDEYGGWGYAPVPVRKTGAPMAPQANISATRFALEALLASGAQSERAVEAALVFVERCQNYTPTEHTRFDDGGFFFIHRDVTRNKAGLAGVDDTSAKRFRSYGSATADGLGAMLLCNRSLTDPRCRAAAKWLVANGTPGKHPGDFEPRREFARNAAYFYYCWSLARTAKLAGDGEAGTIKRLAGLTARDLINRQRADGSWSNEVVDLREDDPLVATSFALAALSAAR